MDVMKVRFEGTDVEKNTSAAYRRVFDDSPEGLLVLEDLMRHCNFGEYSEDPVLHTRLLERSTTIWRIMLMLNGNPVLEEARDDEPQPEGEIDE